MIYTDSIFSIKPETFTNSVTAAHHLDTIWTLPLTVVGFALCDNRGV